MISTCANQNCGKAFNYEEGRFFRFRQSLAANESANAHSVRHFWLCGRCREEYSLEEASRSREDRPEVVIRLVPRAHLSPEAVEV